MSLWFLLWILLSIILLGATFWSTIILVQQKRAWRAYADKYGLSYTGNGFFDSAAVEGIVDGYTVSFFNALQQNPDSRKNKQVTVMQVNVNEKFVDGMACGTTEMIPFLQSLEALTPHDIKTGNLKKGYEIRSRNKKAIDSYLTEERVKILDGILSMPNADILILIDADEGVFRFETPNPLKSEVQIDKLMNKLFVRIKKLQPDEAEAKNLTAIAGGIDVTENSEEKTPNAD